MSSPFKFLDAYNPNDKDIFFGRTEEVDALYALIFQGDLLLVYGQSGTGKTSIIQCGLGSRFKPTDRFELLVRRKDDLNASLAREIRRHAETPIDDDATLSQAIQSLYLDHLRPVHLILDQFEELFVLGSAEEQRKFIDDIAALLKSNVACKVIIVMREEFIASLYEFEKAVPRLFAKRFRVEPMNLRNVARVITGTTAAFGIQLEGGDATAQQIIDSISDRRTGVQLSYLQVYLDTLYRSAAGDGERAGTASEPVVFTHRLVTETGRLEDVLADFLETQTAAIQRSISARAPGVRADAVQQVLEEFTTLEGTKQPMTRHELASRLRELQAVIDPVLSALVNSRVLRQDEEVYELAHDSLARRIADNRSAERKTLLKVHKLIKDRQAAFEQTHTYLNKEELGVATPYLAKLPLTAEESAFVAGSRRNARANQRNLIVATASFVAFLLAVLGYIGWERSKAERTIADAGAVVGFLSRMDAALEPIAGTGDVRRELSDNEEELKRRLGLRSAGAVRVASSEFWSQLQQGDVARRTGRPDSARALYRRARGIAEREAASGNRVWRRNLLVSYESLGDLESALGQPDSARTHYARALSVATALATEDANDRQGQRDVAMAHISLAELDRDAHRFAEAKSAYVAALAIVERLAASGNPQRQRDLYASQLSLGDLAQDAGQLDSALVRYDTALAIAQRLADADPGNPQGRVDLLEAWTRRGDLQKNSGDARAARVSYETARALAEVLAADPGGYLTNIYTKLGDLLVASRPDSAALWYGRTLELEERLARVDTSAKRQTNLAFTHIKLGELFLNSRKLPAARAQYEEALRLARAQAAVTPGNSEVDYAMWLSYTALGDVATDEGRGDAAIRTWYESAWPISERLAQTGNPEYRRDLITTYKNLCDVAATPEAARDWYAKASAVGEGLKQLFPDALTADDLQSCHDRAAVLERKTRK